MRISDWSSDVCSSDLAERHRALADRCRAVGDDARIGALRARKLGHFDRRGKAVGVQAGAGGRGQDAFVGHRRRAAQRSVIDHLRSEEHTSELQSLMRISYAVFCLKKKKPMTREHSMQQLTHKHKRRSLNLQETN